MEICCFAAQIRRGKRFNQRFPKTKIHLSIDEFYYFSESFPTRTESVSSIHAGDLKLYGSSCLVLFYESFSTSYSYTSLGYVENPGELAEVLGTGSVHVDVFRSE